jgi:hypothetical protein
MTRAERAAAQVRKAKEKAEALERTQKEARVRQQEETRKAEAVLRDETRKATYKRRYYVGALADDAGLFAWSNTDFRAVFAVLARLSNVPAPAALLDGLLGADLQDCAPTSDDLAPRSSYLRFPSQSPGVEEANSELPSPLVSGSLS